MSEKKQCLNLLKLYEDNSRFFSPDTMYTCSFHLERTNLECIRILDE